MSCENEKIGKSITVLRTGGMDSNIYLINREFLVDSGTGLQQEAVGRALGSAGASFDSIRQIVLTHAHFDHAGGIMLFQKAKISMHKEDAKVIESGDENTSAASAFHARLNPRKVDFKLAEGDVIAIAGMELRVIHTPGHTRGSICLYGAKEKILFSGDTVFADGIGRTDLPGGNMGEMKKSLERLSRLDIDKMLPGHGETVMSDGTEVIRGILAQF